MSLVIIEVDIQQAGQKMEREIRNISYIVKRQLEKYFNQNSNESDSQYPTETE